MSHASLTGRAGLPVGRQGMAKNNPCSFGVKFLMAISYINYFKIAK
jgi:hypothetical protein